jgi:N-acetylmuramoyl-L-alanine amidase
VTWHHTATSNNYAAADVPGILRSIYQYQAVSRGWGDIGYHVLVDRFGRLWEGRAGGLDRPVIGAHAGGFNRATAGIVVIGNHVSTPVPAAAVESAARYIAWKLALTGPLDPRGTTTLTGGGSTSKYPVGTKVAVPRVFPHGLTNKTACPGQRGSDVLGAIRDRAYALTNSPDPALTVSS